MKLYYAVVDSGDGSAHVRWFKEERAVELEHLLENNEAFYQNEGMKRYINLPDDLDLTTLGIGIN